MKFLNASTPDFLTQFNENQDRPRLRTKTKNLMRSEFL